MANSLWTPPISRYPKMQYAEDNDMTLYRRKDGQRIILFADSNSGEAQKVINVLVTYHQRQFVDYVITSTFQSLFRDVSRYLGIPNLDYEGDGENGSYERLFIQLISASPTCAVVFRKNETRPTKYVIDHVSQHHLPIEVVDW